MKSRYYFFLFLLLVLVVPTVNTYGQKEYDFCKNNWSWGNKESFRETREMKITKTDLLNVDGRRNGSISIKGENRTDILIRACVVAWSDSENAARSMVQGIRIQTNSVIKAENSENDNNWSVSFEILVPKNTNLNLTANNGGISISNVDGNLNFNTKNGGISLNEVNGEVKGRTQNGGVTVKLSGNAWKGSGMDVETTNGGVQISMPENYAAKIETATTNGGFRSDFDTLQVESKKSWGRRSISRDLNGGGATVRVVTTNGGVSIKSQR